MRLISGAMLTDAKRVADVLEADYEDMSSQDLACAEVERAELEVLAMKYAGCAGPCSGEPDPPTSAS